MIHYLDQIETDYESSQSGGYIGPTTTGLGSKCFKSHVKRTSSDVRSVVCQLPLIKVYEYGTL